MCSGGILVAMIVGLLFGPPLAKWPYKLAQIDEMFDAIGRKPAGPVEPAEWKVGFTKVLGVGLSIVGVLGLGGCLLL